MLEYMLGLPDFWFVQVGAYNGITSDPFCKHVIDGLWKGLLIEPQSAYWHVLNEIYQDRPDVICLNVAISDVDGTKKLYRIADDATGVPYWASQLASFRREVIAAHRDRISDIERWIVAQEIPCRTLASVVQEHQLPRVDLLAVDVEGSDYEVIQQIDQLSQHPPFVFYEHLHLSESDRQASWQFLRERDYKLTFHNDGDTFAEQRRMGTPARRKTS